MVFDVLMVNDTNFANHPLSERAGELKKYNSSCSHLPVNSSSFFVPVLRVFQPVKGYIHLVDRKEATTKCVQILPVNYTERMHSERSQVRNFSAQMNYVGLRNG